MHVAGDVAQRGDLLVVTPTRPCDDVQFGKLVATEMHSFGVLRLVTDAGVRDVADLRVGRFPLRSSVISAHATIKKTPGNKPVPLVWAGVALPPGDILVAEGDGDWRLRTLSTSSLNAKFAEPA